MNVFGLGGLAHVGPDLGNNVDFKCLKLWLEWERRKTKSILILIEL